MAAAVNGSIYTKEWVVELILNMAGYTVEKNLVACLAVEPSCGEGAFALKMLDRLIESASTHNVSLTKAQNALRLVDTDVHAMGVAQEAMRTRLEREDLRQEDIDTLLASWFVSSDYLLMPEFREVDFVVGNPPYIRSNDIDPARKEAYFSECTTMTPGSDVFVGFIEKGMKSLKKGGKLSFICADRWMHNSYGKKLREFVSERFNVESIVVMHEVDAFEANVSAYPAIVTMSNGEKEEFATVAFADDQFNKEASECLFGALGKPENNLSRGRAYELGRVSAAKLTASSWPLIRPEKQAVLDYVEGNFPLLEDSAVGTKVGIGMATGSDSVFVVGDHDIVEPERMVPMRTSRQLNGGCVQEEPLWLVNPWEDDGRLVDLAKYPRLERYFNRNKDVLSRRHIAKKRETDWYRTIDRYHSGLEKRPKLLIQDMHKRFEPFYDDSHYPHGNLYYIVTEGWDLKVLGGLLMSDVCEAFVDAYGVKMRGGTLRFQAQFLRKIRVPHYDDISEEVREGLRRAFLRKDYDEACLFARYAFGMESTQ